MTSLNKHAGDVPTVWQETARYYSPISVVVKFLARELVRFEVSKGISQEILRCSAALGIPLWGINPPKANLQVS